MSGDFIFQCGACGAKNRIPAERWADNPRCGSCRAPLIGSHCLPMAVTDADWEEEVLRSRVPVVVEMWSPHCPVCAQYELSIQRLSGKLCGAARVLQMNVEENPRTPPRYDIRGVPTVLVFRDGRLTKTLVGPHGEQSIRAALGLG